MKSILFNSSNEKPPEIAILIKSSGLNKAKIETYYIKPININLDLFRAWELEYDTPKKASAKCVKEHLLDLLPEIEYVGIKTLFVTDGTYFKQLTGVSKVDPFYGEILPCSVKGYEHLKVILSINYQALIYNPLLQGKLDRSLVALKNCITGKKITNSKQIIHHAEYPKTIPELLTVIEKLKTYPALTCDIETKSLEFWNAGLSTISFAWNKYEGIAFAIDRNSTEDFGYNNPIKEFIRGLLLQFFKDYKGTLIFHNASYDMKVLIYELWMENLADYPGMLKGIFTLTKNFHDTKLITYLATNNAIENSLGLKENSAEFTGNYAEDTTDTSIIPIQDLLVYNLQDCLATWYVAEKYWPIMIRDEQKSVYDIIMKPSVKSLLAMELCGMPINPQKVQEAKTQLSTIVNTHVDFFRSNPHIKEVHYQLLQIKADSYTAKAKKKIYTIDDLVVRKDLEEFNPGSDNQIRYLLYDYFGLPEIDYTDSKLPATGVKCLQKLLNHTQNKDIVEIIENLRGYSNASKILTTFIPAFENAQQLPDGSWRLYGNFNLGGTKSGRLSSSNPNLTNIPSHSIFAKVIKSCFEPPKGWLFGGADFSSLEAMISALTTRDKNKLKVYIEGMCSHCYNAYGYYKEQMPDINPNSVESINSIKSKYPELRQASKTKTFLLTYGGSYRGLMSNEGLNEEDAKRIEKSYHTSYEESDKWVDDKIEQAKINGYVTGAFGLRLRTPLLSKCVLGTNIKMPYGAISEKRTAGNMLGQSYGMLNARAANEFIERVWASKYKYDIFLSCQVHDSIYLMFKNRQDITDWINRNLIECMQWCELDELKHPVVKLGAEFGVFFPNWNHECILPNNASKKTIKELADEHQKKMQNM